jgi:hypothetical protein
MSRKSELKAKARDLGLDDFGTIAELQARIDDYVPEWGDDGASIEDGISIESSATVGGTMDIPSIQMSEDTYGGHEVDKSVTMEVDEPEVKEVSKPKVLPKAIPVGASQNMVVAVARVTAVKYVGGFRHLTKGKRVTAPASVMAILREKGYVE